MYATDKITKFSITVIWFTTRDDHIHKTVSAIQPTTTCHTAAQHTTLKCITLNKHTLHKTLYASNNAIPHTPLWYHIICSYIIYISPQLSLITLQFIIFFLIPFLIHTTINLIELFQATFIPQSPPNPCITFSSQTWPTTLHPHAVPPLTRNIDHVDKSNWRSGD